MVRVVGGRRTLLRGTLLGGVLVLVWVPTAAGVSMNIGEAGTLSLDDDDWGTVTLDESYSDPFVLATTQTTDGGQDPSAEHVRDVRFDTLDDAWKFDRQHCEYDRNDTCDNHVPEEVGWVAFSEERLGDIKGVQTGRAQVGDDDEERVLFDPHFQDTPLVFAQVQTDEEGSDGDSDPGHAISLHPHDISTEKFEADFCQQETAHDCDAGHRTETFAWLAVNPDVIRTSTAWSVGTVSQADDDWTTVNFRQEYRFPPIVIVQTQTLGRDNDPLYAEADDVTTASARIRFCDGVDPDASNPDNECDAHSTETVAYLAIPRGPQPPGQIRAYTNGEAGLTVPLNGDEWEAIGLERSYESEPIVFSTTQSDNGSADPSAAHVRDVSTSGFETQHCEWDASDTCDAHTDETNGWVTIDPAEVRLLRGVDAGTFWTEGGTAEPHHTVSLDRTIDDTPLVFAQVQTEEGGNEPLNVQVVDRSASEVTLEFCEQETTDGCDGHTSEKVGWLAIDPNTAPQGALVNWGSVSVSDSNWEFLEHGVQEPAVILSMVQTENGGQEALYSEADRSGNTHDGYVRYCESDGGNACDGHATETVAWLAVATGSWGFGGCDRENPDEDKFVAESNVSDLLVECREVSQLTSDAFGDRDFDELSDGKESVWFEDRDAVFCGSRCEYPDPFGDDHYLEVDGWTDTCTLLGSEETHMMSDTVRDDLVSTFDQMGTDLHVDLGGLGGGGQTPSGDCTVDWDVLESNYHEDRQYFSSDHIGTYHHMFWVHDVEHDGDQVCGVGNLEGDFSVLAEAKVDRAECGGVGLDRATVLEDVTLEEIGHNDFDTIEPEDDQCDAEGHHDEYDSYAIECGSFVDNPDYHGNRWDEHDFEDTPTGDAGPDLGDGVLPGENP